MCANYGLEETDFEAFVELKIPFPRVTMKPEFYPGYQVPAVRSDMEFVALRWGLVPFWSKTEKTPYSTFNATSEKLAKSPAFREPFKKRRCLLPASYFCEFSRTIPKVRHKFGMADGRPFAFAGVWDTWHGGETTVESCTMITTVANPTLEPFHHRMPVILHPTEYAYWLDPKTPAEDLQALLAPFDGAMVVTPFPKPPAPRKAKAAG